MSDAVELTTVDEPAVVIPAELAAILRPELPGLAEEIISEIRKAIPEYARPIDGPYGHALRVGVQQALTSFVDLIADPSASRDARDQVCRKLGQWEAEEGRSLDSLQAAYRIGAQVAWRLVMQVGRAADLSSPVMSQLANAVFTYMDELASLSTRGYLEARRRSADAREKWRRRLLRLIRERPAAPYRAIAELAELAGWPVPDEVTLVAVQADRLCLTPLGDSEPLADLSCLQPHLLIPGAASASQRQALEAALEDGRAAIGLTVPLADAADSLRWARHALALGEAGIIGSGRLTICEDHLVTLWLLSDPALVDQIARRQFAALAGLTPRQQQRLTETFGTWLETRGTAAEIADRLRVHPQTVRYRMRQLEHILGDRLDDPDARFSMELVVRATRLRERTAPA
jgi:DNA-binding CsgD family transcriptional regulator